MKAAPGILALLAIAVAIAAFSATHFASLRNADDILPPSTMAHSWQVPEQPCDLENLTDMVVDDFAPARAKIFSEMGKAAQERRLDDFHALAATLYAVSCAEIGRNPISADAWMTLADATMRAGGGLVRARPALSRARAMGRLEYPIIARRIEFALLFGRDDTGLEAALVDDVAVFLQYPSIGQALTYLARIAVTLPDEPATRLRNVVLELRPDHIRLYDELVGRARAGTLPG